MNQTPETKNKTQYPALLLLVVSTLLVLRLLPVLKSPLSTYGYDYGFYLSALEHMPSFSLPSINGMLWGGFSHPVFTLASNLHLNSALFLNISYFIFSILSALSLYLFFKKTMPKAGVFAALLFALSIIQQESYTMFLWKSAFALPFMILGFKWLMEKKWWPFVISSILIAFTHRTTAIFYFLTVGLYFVWQMIKNKQWKLLILLNIISSVLFVAAYFLFDFKSIILDLVSHNNFYVRTGLFLPGENPLTFMWPVALLAIPGIYFYIKNRQNPILIIFLTLCISWIAFSLPFYRRVWVYLDIILIIFAAFFLASIPFKNRKIKIALAACLIFMTYEQVNFSLNKTPLITTSEVNEIKNFKEPTGFVLATSANDAPWLLAYTKNQRLGAPGLLEDPHTYQEWTDFWHGLNQANFVASYPTPLYLYQRGYKLEGSLSKCLIPISENFYKHEPNCYTESF